MKFLTSKFFKKWFLFSLVFCAGLLAFSATSRDVQAKKKPTYTISPTSKLYNKKKNKKSSTFLLRSYMERFTKTGGGTLVLKKGTYKITTTVYVPSNVTIKFKKGVKIVHDTSGSYSIAMFACAPTSTLNSPKAIYGYEGSHDITFIGNNTFIDAANSGMPISIGHCKNISISGLNMSRISDNYHFIELNSSNNVSIKSCTFDGTSNASGTWKECINIDSDDEEGFNTKWASNDLTCCTNIVISNCSFKNAGGGVGTHNYSEQNGTQKYHTSISIQNCSFENVGNSGSATSATIRAMSWKNASITNNKFVNCHGGKGCPIRADGSDSFTVTKNTFLNSSTSAISSTVKNKTYCCSNNIIYWSKSFNSDHPDCIIYNTYYSTSARKSKVVVSPSANNYYDCYTQNISNNTVSGSNMSF